MSFTIPMAHVLQFGAEVRMLAEQSASRLRRTVSDGDLHGEARALERLGGMEAAEVTDRLGDTPLMDIAHSRRWMYPRRYVASNLIDRADLAKIIIEPKNRYARRHAAAMGRALDRSIIAALGGNTYNGHAGADVQPLPSAQKIGGGSVGMTVAKLISARSRLVKSEVVNDGDTLYFVVSQQQIDDLLEDDKVTSNEYAAVKALVAGEVNSFMGFTFIRTELLPKSGNDRKTYAYTGSAIEFGQHMPQNTRADERPDKNYAWQLFTDGAWGATRIEDVAVVEVTCVEPAL